MKITLPYFVYVCSSQTYIEESEWKKEWNPSISIALFHLFSVEFSWQHFSKKPQTLKQFAYTCVARILEEYIWLGWQRHPIIWNLALKITKNSPSTSLKSFCSQFSYFAWGGDFTTNWKMCDSWVCREMLRVEQKSHLIIPPPLPPPRCSM